MSEKRAATAPAAAENARELAAAVGPWQIAADYGLRPGCDSLPEIAEGFARHAYVAEVRGAAAEGALRGFDEYLAGRPHDPYD